MAMSCSWDARCNLGVRVMGVSDAWHDLVRWDGYPWPRG